MKHIIKVEVLENLPKTRPLIAMDAEGNLVCKQDGTKIWYTTTDGEKYDLVGIIESLQSMGATYNGPAIVSNEYNEEKQMWCMKFDEDVTVLGDADFDTMTVDGPFFVTEPSYGLNCNVETIVLPKTIARIGYMAFYGCSSLTSVTIPNSVTGIGTSAFWHCTGLTSIEIPNSVTDIGDYAFSGCTSLISIKIPNNVTSIGRGTFFECNSLTSVTIPNSVTSIGDRAFYKCSSLTSVTIPNSVTSIGEYAFEDCTNLSSIEIPNSVISIGQYAFAYCSSLTSVTIPNGVISIENNTFSSCSSLMIVNIPDSVITINEYAFNECRNLTNVILGNGVTSIGSSAFNSKLNNLLNPIYNSYLFVKLPGEYIGKYIIPSGIEKLCNTAIYSITGVTSVIIPNSVIYIDYGAFTFSNSLQSIICEAATPPILGGDYVFDNTNDCPIYVPSQSVDAYKAAENWSEYASRIQAIR